MKKLLSILLACMLIAGSLIFPSDVEASTASYSLDLPRDKVNDNVTTIVESTGGKYWFVNRDYDMGTSFLMYSPTQDLKERSIVMNCNTVDGISDHTIVYGSYLYFLKDEAGKSTVYRVKTAGGEASEVFSRSDTETSRVCNLVGYYSGYLYYQNASNAIYKYRMKTGSIKKVASFKYRLQVSTGKYAAVQFGSVVAPGNFVIYKMTTGKKVKTLKTKSYQRGASTGKFYICSQVYKKKTKTKAAYTVTRIQSCTSTGKKLKTIKEVPIAYSHRALMGHTGTYFEKDSSLYKLTYSTKKLTWYAPFLQN